MGLFSWLFGESVQYIEARGIVRQFEAPSATRQALGCLFSIFASILSKHQESLHPRARIEVEIDPPNGPPYRLVGKVQTDVRLQEGAPVAVFIHPKNPTEIRIEHNGSPVGWLQEGKLIR